MSRADVAKMAVWSTAQTHHTESWVLSPSSPACRRHIPWGLPNDLGQHLAVNFFRHPLCRSVTGFRIVWPPYAFVRVQNIAAMYRICPTYQANAARSAPLADISAVRRLPWVNKGCECTIINLSGTTFKLLKLEKRFGIYHHISILVMQNNQLLKT